MDISSSGESPFVVAAPTCETSATYCVSKRTERVPLFRARDANSRIVNITRAVQGSTMEPERGDSKSERLRKRKAVTPHRPAKRPKLFQADQEETEQKAASHLPQMAAQLGRLLRGDLAWLLCQQCKVCLEGRPTPSW